MDVENETWRRNMTSPNSTGESDNTTKPWSVYGEYATPFLILLSIAMVVMCFGNSLILISLVKYRRLRRRSNILIGNMAIADLLVGAVLVPFEIVLITVKHFDDKELVCLLRSCFRLAILGASVMSIFSMSVERFYAIVFPYRYVSCFTHYKLTFLAVSGWVVAIVISLTLYLFGYKLPDDQILYGCVSIIQFKLWFIVLVNSVYVSSLVVCTTMYITVMGVVCKHLHEDGTPETAARKHDVRKTKMMTVVFGLFAVCWTPYCVAVILRLLIKDRVQLIVIENWTLCFAGFNSFLNWIVYGWMNHDFRHAFLSLFRRQSFVTDSQNSASKSSAMARQQYSHS